MRKALICISATLFAGSAMAIEPTELSTPDVTAQMPVWTGLYGGLHGGYGWSDKAWRLLQNAGNNPSMQIGSVVTDHDADGPLGGVQVGYNYQTGRYVIGVEGEVSWTGMDGYSTWLNESALFRDASTEINWLATAAVRAGVTFDHTLVYLKGGAAFAGEDYAHTGGQPATPRFLTGEDTRLGVLAGLGVEHAWTQRWSTEIEYNYMYFGEDAVSLTDGARTAQFDIEQDIHVVKFGINYRFGRR